MTPKEKAIELVEDMHDAPETGYNEHAKVCALIAVDEVLNELPEGSIDYGVSARRRFFEEVKQEIEKL